MHDLPVARVVLRKVYTLCAGRRPPSCAVGPRAAVPFVHHQLILENYRKHVVDS